MERTIKLDVNINEQEYSEIETKVKSKIQEKRKELLLINQLYKAVKKGLRAFKGKVINKKIEQAVNDAIWGKVAGLDVQAYASWTNIYKTTISFSKPIRNITQAGELYVCLSDDINNNRLTDFTIPIFCEAATKRLTAGCLQETIYSIDMWIAESLIRIKVYEDFLANFREYYTKNLEVLTYLKEYYGSTPNAMRYRFYTIGQCSMISDVLGRQERIDIY